MAGPLSGIRVLDLTRILAGPWATQNLADMGADVIKIERPGTGDDTRAFGPPFIHDQHTGEPLHASYFLACNRGKRSVAIDLSTREGAALVRQLIARCDVVVENFKAGDLARYRLDYASLRDEFPELVYCSLTGFGQTGPYAQRPGYDYLIQGMGGLMSVTGERDGLPGGGPQRAGVAVSDILSGMYAALGIVAALRHRDQGHGGQHIDIGMLDVQVGTLANQALNFLTTGVAPVRVGNGHPNLAPYRSFRTLDGHIIVTIGNDQQFGRLCRALSVDHLAADARFSHNASRVRNRTDLEAMLEPLFLAQSTREWVVALDAARVPCGPINTIDRVFDDPQVIDRGMLKELAHPRSGTVPTVASPLRFSQSPVEYDRAPPLLGADTAEVLMEILSLTDADLSGLQAQGVIAQL